jgi:hypothetical protein
MPRLDTDRLITILDAANRTVESIAQIRQSFEVFRLNGMAEVSLDTAFDIINRYSPSYEDLSIILTERYHFKVNEQRIQSARLKMQRLRGDRKSTTTMTTEVEKVGLNLTDYKQNQTSGASEATEQQQLTDNQSSDYLLPAKPTLGDYHELLRQTFGAILVYRGQIYMTIQDAAKHLSQEEIVEIVKQMLDQPDGPKQYLTEGQFVAGDVRMKINDLP